MALSNSEEAVIEFRREQVAELVLAKFSQREIVTRLFERGVVDPETGNAWSTMTVNRDIKAIKAQWRRSSKRKIDQHIADQYAELESIKKALWPNRANPRHSEVLLSAMTRQSQLLGLDKPVKSEVSFPPELLALAAAQGIQIRDVIAAMLAIMSDKAPQLATGQTIDGEIVVESPEK